MKVVAIAGSLRDASQSAALVRGIRLLAPAGVNVEVCDLLGSLPLFSPDIDDASVGAVEEFRSLLGAADAVLICTPEYAYGMPGALKNGLDWLVSSGELYRKPVGALSSSPSPGGGSRALGWLLQTLDAVGAIVPEQASFSIPAVRQKLEGDTIVDEETAAKVVVALRRLEEAAVTASA